MNEPIRVNKITARLEGEQVILTLYRTNKKLGILTNDNIGVPSSILEEKNINKTAYVNYCKEVLINLLRNGGIQGYRYDPPGVKSVNSSGRPRKYGNESFRKWAIHDLADILDKMEGLYGYDINEEQIRIRVSDEYKNDGMIKYGSAELLVTLYNEDGDKTNQVMIPLLIKSGQLTKPKIFFLGDQDMSFNQTNIIKLANASVEDGKA